MLWYISTHLKASAFKGENNIFPFFTLAGLSQREQLGRRKSRVTRVDCTKWNFPGSADSLAVLSGAESCSAWVKWNSKTKHYELFISSKIPVSSPDAAEAQITLSKIPIGQPKEPVLTTAHSCQHTLCLQQTKSWNKKENEKKENVTAAQSVGAQRHCWLMH